MKVFFSVFILCFIFIGCSSSRGHIFEVYQGGVKVNEECRISRESFSSNGSYYKMTTKTCKVSCGCFRENTETKDSPEKIYKNKESVEE